jgi:hypothetical protein
VNRSAIVLFDADRIVELLTELGARLHRRGIEARIFIVGGAAMALAYNRTRVTRDIDAVFEPKTVVYDEARAMAAADDLRILIGVLGITSVEQAFAVVDRHYDRSRLSPKTQFFVEEIVAEALAGGP